MNHFENPNGQHSEVKEKFLSRIESASIRDTYENFLSLSQKIFESGKSYDLILSDDASGRMVSLFVKEVLDEVQKSRNIQKPDIRFVASGRHDNEETFETITNMIKKMSPGRTLIVTEHIATGESIKKLASIFEKLGLKFDIATLSQELGRGNNLTEFMPDDVSFFSEQRSSQAGISFYGDRGSKLTGVRKVSSNPYPKKTITSDITEKRRSEMQKVVNQARKDISILAQEALRRLGIKAE